MPSKFTRMVKSQYIGQFEIGMIFGGWKVSSPIIWKDDKKRMGYIRCVCSLCNKTRKYVRIEQLLKSSKGCNACANPDTGIGPFSGRLIHHWKSGASRRNIKWELTHEQLLNLYNKQNGKCALTGEVLTFSTKNSLGNVSLDRITSSLGYCETNVQLVTKKINMAKHLLEQTEFIEMCRKVAYYNDVGVI